MTYLLVKTQDNGSVETFTFSNLSEVSLSVLEDPETTQHILQALKDGCIETYNKGDLLYYTACNLFDTYINSIGGGFYKRDQVYFTYERLTVCIYKKEKTLDVVLFSNGYYISTNEYDRQITHPHQLKKLAEYINQGHSSSKLYDDCVNYLKKHESVFFSSDFNVFYLVDLNTKDVLQKMRLYHDLTLYTEPMSKGLKRVVEKITNVYQLGSTLNDLLRR